jgi:hypothetical protein
VSQARVSQGRLAFGVGWWLVHGAMLVVVLALFARHVTPLRLRWLRR